MIFYCIDEIWSHYNKEFFIYYKKIYIFTKIIIKNKCICNWDAISNYKVKYKRSTLFFKTLTLKLSLNTFIYPSTNLKIDNEKRG